MIRIPRRAALLSLVCLMAFAASASAECAWVKWWTGSDVDMTWNILDAFPRLPDCDQSLKADVSRLKRDGYEVHGAPGVGHGVSAQKGNVKRVYQCLPDTVDPRGPNGK